MLNVKIKITGDKEEIAKLTKLGQSFTTFTLAMRDIGRELKDFYANQVMNSEGGAIGESWPELSANYAFRKAHGNTKRSPLGKGAYPGTTILVASGKLQKGFDSEADAKSVTIYNDDPKFAYHNSDEERKGHLPQRKIFKVTDEVRDVVNEIINRDIKKKIREAGL